MQPSETRSATPYSSTGIHPLLRRFADEVHGTAARLFAYVGFLALLAIGAVHIWQQLPPIEVLTLADDRDWSGGGRLHPPPQANSADSIVKSAAYVASRHPEDGRKDASRRVGEAAAPALPEDWLSAAGKPRLRGAL